MRIGIDYRAALVNREGIGRATRELVRGMLELNMGPNLGLFGYTLAPMRVPRDELGLAGSGAELLRLRLPARVTPWLLARLGRGVDDLVGGCDVYHHTQPNLLAVRKAAEVVTVYDTIYLNRDAGYLDPEVADGMAATVRAAVARAKRVLVPTEFVGAEVVMSFGVFPNKVSVTGLGCDHVVRHLPPGDIPRESDAPYVLTVARVDARKNHLRMLRAFERLVADGLPHRWLVVGPRGYGSEDFETALERSPAKHRIEWRRDVRDAELALLYARASLFLFASLSEGFGLPPLEAMACGCPVVASAVTSLPEVLGDAAWYVEPTDEERIFEAARRLLTEPALAEDLVLRGRQQARKHTWKDAARATLIAYQKAASGEEDEGPGLLRTI